jgi:hypothetical protein
MSYGRRNNGAMMPMQPPVASGAALNLRKPHGFARW